MIWLWVAFALCLLATVVGVWIAWRTNTDHLGVIMLAIGGATGALTFGVLIASYKVSQHLDLVACDRFSEQANRETRFVVYTDFQWDCLTPSGDGKWISTENLRELTER